ncbi:hypothetical protein ABIE41_000417 [Bosea sp. OAE506]|uniref:hypothetical protein n=1 Tax=Bosea sp. OAE506 TaxID=2663870 RepID=UPI001789AE9F
MNTNVQPVTVKVTIPEIDEFVLSHHQRAESEIARMSPSRRRGAETTLQFWRRRLTAIDPNGTDGFAFSGDQLQKRTEVALPVGALIVARDASWAQARWYADSFVRPYEQNARLLRVGPDGLETLIETTGRNWARDVLGFLMTAETILLESHVLMRSKRCVE